MDEIPEAGAAAVASRLLAFYREPVRHRPALTHGREVIAGGGLVFRLAQGKFPHALMKDMPPQARAELREAADAFIRQVCLWEGATHYQMLCVPPSAKRAAIKEHYHLLMSLIHPDRQDPAQEQWPSGCAQRINRAYEVLSDEQAREEYDRGLAKLETEPKHPAGASPEVAMHRNGFERRTRARGNHAKALGVATLAVVPLLALQILWINDPPRELSFADGLARLGGTDASNDRPRFLTGISTVPAAIEAEPEPGPKPDRAAWTAPQVPALAALVAPALPPLAARPETVVIARPEPVVVARQESAAIVAQAPPPSVAQAASEISAKDVETIVALLVGFYEAGDADRLMGLFDSGGAGLAQARQAYQEFFRATRTRQLRVDRLEWQTRERSARARGTATLLAEYSGNAPRLQRTVDIDLDIELRDGRPRITRLALFPNGN